MTRVIELTSYPVKGCAGVARAESVVTPAGLVHDRSFMVTTDDGTFRSQRRDPRLALIHPDITTDGDVLALRTNGAGEVRVDVDRVSARREVALFGKPYTGIDQGDLVAEWLSDVLGKPSRLVCVPPEHDRVVTGHTQATSGYADSSPIHLTTLESLDVLNDRIAQRCGEPVIMDRFRPNIVVEGWGEPYAEDRLCRIDVGDTELAFSKVAIRCAVTTVDQERAVKVGPEPLRTLADYRRTV